MRNRTNKTKRSVTPEIDYWSNWVEYYQEQGFQEKDYVQIRAEAEARGVDADLVRQEYQTAYNDLRKDWQEDMTANAEIAQQKLIVRNNNLDSTCAVYQRADRILTGASNLVVEAYDDSSTEAPAWSDGSTITFNATKIKGIDEDTIRSLHGLNYHEVSHVLYTPRIGSELGQWVKDNNLMNAFNTLEDARAERLLTTKYPSVREFLIATVGEYLINDPDTLADNFVLLAGRKYFSYKARQLSASLFTKKYGLENAKLVYSLINEYTTLAFPADYKRAKEILRQLNQFITENMATDPDGNPTHGGCGGAHGRGLLRNGRPESGKEQERLQKQAGQGEGGDDLFGSGQSDTGGSEDDSIKPTTTEFRENDNDLLEVLQAEVERAKTNKAVRNKVAETQRAIAKSQSTKSLLPNKTTELVNPTNLDITASYQFGTELERLRIDLDPAWVREVPSGKLNVRRAMLADVNEINKLFDRWDTGNDDHDIEACILIDRSGSMYQDIGSACRASWIIKRGIERINGRVTVMSFNQASHLISSGDIKATSQVPVVSAQGSTDPEYALLETERIMAHSTKPTKLVFLLTDGQFSSHTNDKIISRLKSLGCITNLVYLAGNEQTKRWLEQNADREDVTHGVDNFRAIINPMDLVKVAKDIVKHHLTKSRRR